MSVRFRNPWVDPRVLAVRPGDLADALRAGGWSEIDSPTAHIRRFVSPPRDGDRETALVPTASDDGRLLNLLVEAIGKLAAWEGRYAGDIVSELLRVRVGPAPRPARPVAV